jgi:hypothetical protein
METNIRARVINVGLLARSQFASGRFCDRPTRSKFSVVFLGPRANAELVPKFHVILHASHAALSMITLKISPYINVTYGLSDNTVIKALLLLWDGDNSEIQERERPSFEACTRGLVKDSRPRELGACYNALQTDYVMTISQQTVNCMNWR